MPNYDFRPMEPLPWSEAFSEPGWLYQVKWDGVRMLALWEQGKVQLVNRKGAGRSRQYPEISGLSDAFPAGTLIDGELVVLVDGRTQFDLILKRDQRRQPLAIKQGAKLWPVTYAVFDLLYWQGEDIRAWPLTRRQSALTSIWPTGFSDLHLVESFTNGLGLFEAVGELGGEGIVAKRLASAYVPGKGSSDWRKIKHWHYMNCVVGGYTLRAGLPSALLLGVYDDADLIYVGRVGSGISDREWQALLGFLQAATKEESPFSTEVQQPPHRETKWVEPKLAVKVKFMEWTSDLKLRAPAIMEFLPADQVDCGL